MPFDQLRAHALPDAPGAGVEAQERDAAVLTRQVLDQSGLMLADGLLTVLRITSDLNLAQTWLVTLGACRSGAARIQVGDELVGLAQAILTAGARVVVASHWNVDNRATQVLKVLALDYRTYYPPRNSILIRVKFALRGHGDAQGLQGV